MNKQLFLEYAEIRELTKKELIFILAITVASILVFLIPSSFEKAKNKNIVSVKTLITTVDDSTVRPIGLIRTGEQHIEATVLEGKYKNTTFSAINRFMGKLELDRVYKEGDKVLVSIENRSDGKNN